MLKNVGLYIIWDLYAYAIIFLYFFLINFIIMSMRHESLLRKVSIVLVDTKTPANIGATARCMMNMGLSHLVLVRPPSDEAHEATKLAADAVGILNSAEVYSSLKDAIADQMLVFGTSRHKGKLRENLHTPHEAAKMIIAALCQNKIAILFGNEVNGLDREDLSLCHEFIAIPSSYAFPSLNLSHAVMIIAYELFIASKEKPISYTRELARAGAIEDFYRHLQHTLEDIDFLDRSSPQRMMFSLRQLFGRSRLSRRDVSILRGILTAMDRISASASIK